MHPEPEDLAALAADGAEPSGAIAEHLRSCEPCRSEFEAYVEASVQALASVGDLGLEAPPASVWEGVHGELGLDARYAADPLASASASTASETASAPAASAASDAPMRAAVPIRPADAAGGPRRGVRRWWPAVAAAAAVIGLVAGIAIGANVIGSGSSGSEKVIAEARLEPFPGWNADGRAFLEQDRDGRYSMLIELDGDVDVDGLTEVWLLREEPIGLVSLGLLDGRSARFALPDDLDLSEFSVVDLSAEPSDGNPTHSGDSIVRGQLQRL
ncbi:anti-sigma factor [Agromyces aureus]|uniref:Anti-sigma factor n=1 Tax=Agromyces aureus TaxID=453304 RepID=A0A191WC41_9MICO|nr:anti-sigma factor [Agromyces aureus]ANJ25749.1 hypothetical protein ATC03_02180 [Agromyces aureus]